MIVGAGCCVPTYAQHKMSLKSLFDLADRQNQRIKVSEAALKAAEEGVVSAKSAMLPSVEFSLQGSYTGNAFLMSRGFSTSGTTEYIVPGLGPQQVQNGKQPTPHWGNSFTAQALEAACWIAIRKAHRVVLAGDHRQLPPTIKCPEALRGGLDRTLMQAIVENKPKAVSLLCVQYRMCDTIMQFPNQEFYGGRLESAPEVKYRGILDWDTPVEWIDSADDNGGEITDGLSLANPAEAALTLQTLQRYFERIGKDRILEERIDVGIISPYKGQIRLLRQLLRKDRYWRPFRSLITVNTVDGFQGQERDVIVISMVRSNAEGNIGFLHDLRRMNVAITRARMKLILIGDRSTLCRIPFYKRLLSFCEQE